jgi:hypothetical protein
VLFFLSTKIIHLYKQQYISDMETPHLPLPSAASFAEGFHFDDLKTGELKIESIDDLAIAIFGEDLDTLGSRMQVHDDPVGKPVTRATQLIKIYLIKMDAECARCVEYRSRVSHPFREYPVPFLFLPINSSTDSCLYLGLERESRGRGCVFQKTERTGRHSLGQG